jgi:hypothetical protein
MAMPCFDRIDETQALWQQLAAGRNLLMLAPRRIGKTVLLNQLLATATANGFRAILLDVEGLLDEKAFFRECCASIQEEQSTGKRVMANFSQRLSQLLHGSGAPADEDWRGLLVRTDWQAFAETLFEHIDDHQQDPPWVILVDELPVFLQRLQERDGAAAIRDFLYWLRGMRQKHRRIRWLYAGSIGLDSVARRNRVEGALNDLDPFQLGPFPPAVAHGFLADVAARRGLAFTDDAAGRVCERLGWLSPYYLERIAEDACASAAGGGAVDLSHVDAAMSRLLDLDKRLYWASWREHLDRNFPEPDRTRLYRVLETVARSNTGADGSLLLSALARGDQLVTELELRDLLDTLTTDGYLIRAPDGRYGFQMSLLREWWLRFVVL